MLDYCSRSISTWIRRLIDCMGGCLGCCTKPRPIISVNDPSKGLRVRGETLKKANIPDDFWSTSTCEMDNSGNPSQRSISSISNSYRTDTHSGSSSTSNPPEFVNHGKYYLLVLINLMMPSKFYDIHSRC
ncbi:hypothetical protein AQUCO_02000116v1 [Aquilegia coerulea]|uniref:DUF4050 domain-containing protein n=1 Tax=Aquilegia coerulea TaxID=218851 RepID=A0A2G5DG03_AQUCA|nr:hypothetical protein AQUCO_02000116v1 [Aquilegia coerulea]